MLRAKYFTIIPEAETQTTIVRKVYCTVGNKMGKLAEKLLPKEPMEAKELWGLVSCFQIVSL
jgi:hypothetical protein